MVDCSFTNQVVVGLNPVAVTYSTPVDTRRRFNVYKTSATSYRHLIDVEMMSCVYWDPLLCFWFFYRNSLFIISSIKIINWHINSLLRKLLFSRFYFLYHYWCFKVLFLFWNVLENYDNMQWHLSIILFIPLFLFSPFLQYFSNCF